MARHDGRPRSLPNTNAGCWFAKGICPFHGVQHEFTEPKEEE